MKWGEAVSKIHAEGGVRGLIYVWRSMIACVRGEMPGMKLSWLISRHCSDIREGVNLRGDSTLGSVLVG